METSIDKDMIPHVAADNIISLDGDIPVHSGEPIVIIRPKKKGKEKNNSDIAIWRVSENLDNVINQSIAGYGISGKTTRVTLENGASNENNTWIETSENTNFSIIRKTTVYCQPEELELAGEPITDEITKDHIGTIDIEGVCKNLPQNRRIILVGEQSGNERSQFNETGKITSTSKTSETALQLGAKETNIEYTNISIELDNKEITPFLLKRDTVKIYGNVVAATQGETRREVLGSGDGRKESQTFALKQANEKTPLTYVSAATPTGAASTLKVFVNDIQWDEAEILTDRTSTDQNFLTKTDEDGKVRVIFGDGKHGARLPTGNENVKAEYRTGLGGAGNVKAGQISLLMDRSLGVKEVINPIAAGSGSDKDKLEQARKNVLRKIKALDRLISVQDYEDFTAAYAGIGKAKAVEISNGKQQVVHVTVAGTTSEPLGSTSELFKKLRKALYDFGDPQQKILLADRELLHIVLKAKVRILPKYQWEPVKMQLQRKLLDAFSYDRRELGQDVLLGEMYSIMQAVPGVDYVDMDVIGGIFPIISNPDRCIISQSTKRITKRLPVNLAQFINQDSILPAQLAFLSSDLPETLILDEIK